nr:hypothetical protein [Saprospiraceae bacterium]
LLLPLMLPYLVRAGTVESYGYSGVVGNLPTLSSHYFSKSGSLLWDVLSHHGTGLPAWWDHQLFAGGIATVCLLLFWSKEVASVFRKGWQTWSPTRSLFVVSLLTFLCYLRVGEASIYRLLFELPGFGSIRALARIINIELIFFAVATAIVVSHLYRIPKWGLLASLLLLGGVVFDNYLPVGKAYRTLKEDAESRTEFLVAKLNDLAPGTVISYEPDSISEPAAFIQLDAMMASQALALKCLNGYSATAPVGFSFYWDRPNPETRMRWLKQKKAEDLQIEVIR